MQVPLWFFIAFVSGWGLRIIVRNIGDLMQSRSYTKTYPAVLLWNIFLVLLIVEMWVAAPFNDTDVVKTSAYLLFVLLPTAVMVLGYVLQPWRGPFESKSEDSEEEPEKFLPLEQAFNRNRIVFFGVLLALPILSILRELLENEFDPSTLDFGFRLVIAAGALVGLFIKGKNANTILAAVMIVVIFIYTVVVFPFVSTSSAI